MALTIEEKRQLFEEFKNKLKEEEEVYVEVCRDDIVLPEYAHDFDAGMDIRAAEEITLLPGETKIVPTGLKVAIPVGCELQVRPRSGLSLKTPLRIANAPGTIDAGYRDEVGVIVTNTSLEEPFIINKGDRIAQFVLAEFKKMKCVSVNNVKSLGLDRGGGFGHTGVK